MTNFVSDRIRITQTVLGQIAQAYTDQDLDKALDQWWANKRKKGGLGLTEAGHEAFLAAGLEFFDIQDDTVDHQWLTSLKLLKLDRYLKCPYHLIVKKRILIIRIFDSRIAAMIHLHGGLSTYIARLGTSD